MPQSGITPGSSNEKAAPLSSWQKSIWFLDQMETGSDMYNRAKRLRLKGALDVAALERSIREIFRRHQVLQSRVTIEDGEPCQRLVADYEFSLRVVDVSALSGPERDARYAEFSDAEARAPFDLAAGPFARAALVRMAVDEHVLLVTAHHIAFDGWSTSILFDEMAELYGEFVTHGAVPREDLPFQYADFAVWQRTKVQSPAIAADVNYWVAKLTGAPSVLELPADHPRPTMRSNVAGCAMTVIPVSVAHRLGALGREEGATLFMTLFAAFQLLLSRLSGQDDVVVGVPVAGRSNTATERVIGCFINVLPLRARVGGDESFRELLRDARSTSLEGFAHQGVPFDLMVERLRPERGTAYMPLTQVLFNFRNMPADAPTFAGLGAELNSVTPASLVSDIDFDVEQRNGELYCTALYNAQLFDGSTVDRWLGHFRTLLDGIVACPDAGVSAIPLLSEHERTTMLRDWNSTALDYPRSQSLAELIEGQVERTPDATAVICGDTVLSYRELNERANRLAHELGELGVCAGSRVGLYVERSVDMMTSLLAIIKSGAGYVPLDTALPAERVAYMVTDSGANVLIASHELIAGLPRSGARIIDLDRNNWKANSCTNPGVAVSDEDIAYIMYTSGSTGTPKGVQVPRRALVNLLWAMREKFRLGVMDRVLAVTTISFDIAGVDIWLPWLVGATTVVAGRAEAASGHELRALIDRRDITFLQATPATWRLLLASGWQGKRDFQAASSGEVIPTELAARLSASVGRFWNLYGPTETTIWSTGTIVSEPVQKVSIGRPLANSQCYILDKRLEPQPIGVIGELYIAGDGLALGYQNRPELTRGAFVPNPFAGAAGACMYRSGDLARYHIDGDIEWLGRTDNQVKIRGFRIELGEIEGVLERHEHIRQAVVVVREDTPGDRRLVAYVVVNGDMPSASELRKKLMESVPEYMIPFAYVAMDAIPLTASGKIDRRALPEPKVSASAPGVSGRRPDSPAQAELVQIWQELLGVPSVDVTADFFELGGHSLLAAAVMERIAASFGRRPPLSVLFEEPTIQHLSRWLIADIGFVEPRAVCINEGAPDRAPLFLFHGDFRGGGLYARKLLRHLDPALPVFVIGPHLPGGPETIEAMADDLLPQVREIQPHGPYLLLGYCNGGVVALEAASRLIADGEQVDFLGIIDVSARNAQLAPLFKLVGRATALLGLDQHRQLDTFVKLREPALRFLADELPQIDNSSSFARRALFGTALAWLVVRRAARRGWRAVSPATDSRSPDVAERPEPVESLSPEERTRIERDNYIRRAMWTYIPKQYNGCVTLIRSSEGPSRAAPRDLAEWRSVVAHVNAITIPGSHTGIVTSDIAGLGAVLREQIPETQFGCAAPSLEV